MSVSAGCPLGPVVHCVVVCGIVRYGSRIVRIFASIWERVQGHPSPPAPPVVLVGFHSCPVGVFFLCSVCQRVGVCVCFCCESGGGQDFAETGILACVYCFRPSDCGFLV